MSGEIKNDVFISYSSQNLQFAHAICNYLEHVGIRCWYAPRNITPGRPWAGEIFRGITASKVFVLVLTPESNKSDQVLREVDLAVNNKLHIITFIVENTDTTEDLKYYISSVHWIDAITKPIEENLNSLVIAVTSLLNLNPIGKINNNVVFENSGENITENNFEKQVNEQEKINIVASVPEICAKTEITSGEIDEQAKVEHVIPKQMPSERASSKQVEVVTLENYDENLFEISGETLIKYLADEESVIIPSGIVKINGEAFKDKKLVKVTIPESVKEIGTRAFFMCKNLTDIILPPSITKIESLAFYGCESLSKIALPDNLVEIEQATFAHCKNLKNVVLPQKLEIIANGAFSICLNLESLILPNNVKKICQHAFQYAFKYGASITISDSVEIIEDFAFSNCNSLTIVCSKGSVAEIYATDPNRSRHGYSFSKNSLPMHKVEYIKN